MIEYVQSWGWDYALRVSGQFLFMPKGTGAWQRLDAYPLERGDKVWFGNVVLTQASAYPTNLVVNLHNNFDHGAFSGLSRAQKCLSKLSFAHLASFLT